MNTKQPLNHTNKESSTFNALIIEDDEYFRRFVVKTVQPFFQIRETDKEAEALTLLQEGYFDLVVIDVNLYGKDCGLNILKQAKSKNFFCVMLTDNDTDEVIHDAYQLGCNHYLTKEQSENVLTFIVKERIDELKNTFSLEFFQKEYVTQHEPLITEISSLKKRLMDDRSLLILGATGTGKTKLAEMVHNLSGGQKNNFVSLNVAAIPENLLESELFGYVKGAFTGADKEKKGMLELANQGTLFLDEVTAMPLSTQKKLLKCLDEKKFYPLGSVKATNVHFRLVSATCEDVYKLIQDNLFRLDLFYRINGLILNIPPLNDRPKDVSLLIKHYLKRGSRQVIFHKNAMALLERYAWPGNIRELKSVVEQLSSLDTGIIHIEHLPDNIRFSTESTTEQTSSKYITKNNVPEEQVRYAQKYGLNSLVEKVQADVLLTVYEQNNKDAVSTYTKLQLSRANFYKLLNKAIEIKARDIFTNHQPIN